MRNENILDYLTQGMIEDLPTQLLLLSVLLADDAEDLLCDLFAL